jgi:guanosine-3',5'-bis(diphosphate) 3'-pyrophosphohydrolase
MKRQALLSSRGSYEMRHAPDEIALAARSGVEGSMKPKRVMNPKQAELLVDALAFAALKHRDQRRKDPDASPYINHPIALARVLSVEAGLHDAKLLAAAVLHDTLEDTETTFEELRERFGKTVATIVREVTDDRSLPKAERKRLQIEHAEHLSQRARLVKLADKICNVRDIASNSPRGWSLQRRREYFDWAKAVIDQIRGTNKTLEKLFEEAYAGRP